MQAGGGLPMKTLMRRIGCSRGGVACHDVEMASADLVVDPGER